MQTRKQIIKETISRLMEQGCCPCKDESKPASTSSSAPTSASSYLKAKAEKEANTERLMSKLEND
jgi:hypothetical protein